MNLYDFIADKRLKFKINGNKKDGLIEKILLTIVFFMI